MKKYLVITTIHPKSEGITRFEKMGGWHIILVGDRKSQPIKSSKNVTFLSIEDQHRLGYEFVEVCPYDHYSRKNIGYLYAIQRGADIIYDVDDDNLPYKDWAMNDFTCNSGYISDRNFLNVYEYFTDEFIWPRGFPLDEIHKVNNCWVKDIRTVNIGVWQGLADNDPDVDAIYRLVIGKNIRFEDKPPIAISRNVYSPFNSQNTLWNKKAFPFLYLPVTISFRFTDILRGYVAQRLMWEQDLHLGFTKATVFQERNAHNLMKDFADEVECYLDVKPITSLLDSCYFSSEPLLNLEIVYKTLAERNLIKLEEVSKCQAWMRDYMNIVKD